MISGFRFGKPPHVALNVAERGTVVKVREGTGKGAAVPDLGEDVKRRWGEAGG